MKTILWIIVAIAILNCLSEVSSIEGKAAHAQEKPTPQLIESWKCFDKFSSTSSPVLARLKRFSKGVSGHGVVEVAGVSHEAKFRIEGFDRRWDFGRRVYPSGMIDYDYAFIIQPNKEGFYYDGPTYGSPDQFFRCEKE